MESIQGEIYQKEVEEISQRRQNAGLDVTRLAGEKEKPDVADGLSGLALSGGGIRSASFSLGVVQSLVENDQFKGLDYISTVSGGGYTGACVSSVLQQDKDGAKEFLPRNGTAETLIMHHLRNCSNYLLPQGLIAKFILPTTFFKGVLYNLLIAFPLLVLAVFLTEMIHELTVILPYLRGELFLLGLIPFFVLVVILPFTKAFGRKKTDWNKRFRTDKTLAGLFLVALVSILLMPLSIFIDDFVTQDVSQFLLISSLDKSHIIGAMLSSGSALLIFLVRAGNIADYSRVGGKVVVLLLSCAAPIFVLCVYLMLCLNVIRSSNVSDKPIRLYIANELNELSPDYWQRLARKYYPDCEISAKRGRADKQEATKVEYFDEDEFSRAIKTDSPIPYVVDKTLLSYQHFLEHYSVTLKEPDFSALNRAYLSPAKFLSENLSETQENKFKRVIPDKYAQRLLVVIAVQDILCGMIEDILRSKKILLENTAYKFVPLAADSDIFNNADKTSINLGKIELLNLKAWEFLRGRQAQFHITWMNESQVLWIPELSLIPPFILNELNDAPTIVQKLTVSAFFGNGQWWFYLSGLLLFILTHRVFNANWISQLNFYRDRLSFTFCVQNDNNELKSTDDVLLSELNGQDSVAPYHLVNVALNLPASRDADLRGRNAVPFFFSKHYTGSDYSGFCQTTHLEKKDPELTLATAMATSAAAASPNMGPQTVKSLVFILALLNVRLCYWLRNPAKVNDKMKSKVPGPAYILREAFSQIDGQGEFVNLSDGGHIENLGLYQLLKRHCSHIVCVDGEADPNMEFNSLAILMRYARIDMGINISFDGSVIRPDEHGNSKESWQLAHIDYGNGETGKLLYVKLSVTGREQADIGQYRQTNPPFPHQPTSDQFFDETQFEVYRALGHHIGTEMAKDSAVSHFWNEIIGKPEEVNDSDPTDTNGRNKKKAKRV